MNYRFTNNINIGRRGINELIGVVSDLHRADCFVIAKPSEKKAHFKISRILNGSIMEFINEYPLSRLTEVMKRAYIHFHKIHTLEIRDYKEAEKVELPPESYFLTPSDIHAYPEGFKVFINGMHGNWLEIDQNLTQDHNYKDILDAELLGHVSGLVERYIRAAQEKAKNQINNLLNE